MKAFFTLTVIISFSAAVFAQTEQAWYQVQFDPADTYLQVLKKAGVIEAGQGSPGAGWMTERDFEKYSPFYSLMVLAEESRPIIPFTVSSGPDTLGQVLEVYSLPPQVESVRGLGYDGEYFYIADADINNEKIHKLDPNNNFAVVKTFPSPGPGGFLRWGASCWPIP